MKKFILFFVVIFLFATSLLAQKGWEAQFSQPHSNKYQVSFSITDWELAHVAFDGVNYQQIVFSSSSVTQEKGWAELPFVSASVQLPARKNVNLSVTYTEFTDYQLDFPLLPSRGVIYRNQDPNTIPYQITPESLIEKFYPGNLANAEEPFVLRDVRGTSVRVFPFQYNAVTNTLRVYTKMDVLLTENNETATNPLLRENPNPIREARGMYKSIFINYQEPRVPLVMADHGDILVITTSRDEDAIQPYIVWKKEKGFNVTKEVVPTNTQAATVKALIQDKYNTNPNLMYVLLVGDWADIKSETYTNAPTDPMLGDLSNTTGAYRPEISIGRMAGNNPGHITTQVNKAIQYEKNPDMSNWYSSFIGISSSQGPGDDGEYDFTHVQRIYSERLEPIYNYTTHYRVYENEPNCNISYLTNYINSGASTIAYCGHGSETSWGTTGFSNSDVNQLTNGTKLPFIVSVACVNGAFHGASDCFAEAWLKKENGGAVLTWMSTINQPWDPPMRGEDYFYDILIGGFNYNNYPGQNGINTEELRTHWGSIVVNAANLMLAEANSSSDQETVRTWCTFGDPNLQLRTKQPAVLASSSDMMLVGTPFTTTITANGNAVKDALVCISQNGVYKSAFTNASGQVSIANEFTPGEVLLVVTAFNTNTIYDNILCVAPEGPYVISSNYSVVGAEKLTYISTNTDITVTVKNVGVAPTSGTLNVSIACDDPQLTINNGTAQYTAVIAPDGTANVNFNVTVANAIQDDKTFQLNVTITSVGNEPWISKLTLKAYAPEFKLDKVKINDAVGGKLPIGNLAKITCVVDNRGGADAYNVVGELIVTDQYIIIPCQDEKNREPKNLAAGESMNLDFLIVTSPNMPSGYEVNFGLSVTAQYGRSYSESFTAASSGSGSYCSSGNQNCTDGDKFTSVIFFKTSEPSNLLINNTNTTCASGGYQDYTNIIAELEPGQNYTIKIKCGYGSQYVRGWFDLNGNGNFESNEMLVSLTCSSANTEVTQNFTIPLNFEPGVQRFRLVCKWNSAPTAACDNSSYGQTHDYTVILPELYPRVQNVHAELEDDNITVTWEAPAEGTPIGYNIYRAGNKLNGATPLTYLTFTEENIEEGVFVYNVTAVYTGNKESYPEMSNVICNFLPCEKPENLQGIADGKNAKLTWNPPVNINGVVLKGYDVYRNGNKINQNLITVLEYKDENLDAGTYKYQVQAIYEHCESDKTNEVSVVIDPEFCEPPVNVMLINDEISILITWDAPENIDGILLGYNVYLNDNKINEEIIEEREYRAEITETGSYQVSAVYEHCESELSETVGVKEYIQSCYNIFPNPTTGEFRISNYELQISSIEIFDVLGKKVFKQETQNSKPEININLSHLQTGVYFVKIYTEENHFAVKRLVIMK